jgi:glutamine synthetase
MAGTGKFIEKYGLWGADQVRAAAELRRRLEINAEGLRLIRVAWADPHGASRAKMVSVPTFLAALETGYNINVATTTLDSANARTFSSFTRGGGMGLDEMTGSPNLTIVPDPTTFRVLPWAPDVGWVLSDEYFNSGVPFHFSPRHILRRALKALEARGMRMVTGLEVEWYLLRLADEALGAENVGMPGQRGMPPRTLPVEPGYSYHSETNMDMMQPLLGRLAETLEALNLPLRSIENEWGPGQVECTFAAGPALSVADDLVLFRTAVRQVCRRNGYFATFMCRPGLPGYFSSGWHLHFSLTDARDGRNLFMPDKEGEVLNAVSRPFLGGILAHAPACSAFTTPTVNGYRRFQPNSLAPDRAGWGFDNRGAMLRVLAVPGDGTSRFENRVGEPAANPYLYIASQIIAGLDGLDTDADPGPGDDAPYEAKRAPLPVSLTAALDTLEKSDVFRTALGPVFMDYFLRLKRNEAGRFDKFLEERGEDAANPGDVVTEWEQNEYFDFF